MGSYQSKLLSTPYDRDQRIASCARLVHLDITKWWWMARSSAVPSALGFPWKIRIAKLKLRISLQFNNLYTASNFAYNLFNIFLETESCGRDICVTGIEL